jgi:hypothetical protein
MWLTLEIIVDYINVLLKFSILKGKTYVHSKSNDNLW